MCDPGTDPDFLGGVNDYQLEILQSPGGLYDGLVLLPPLVWKWAAPKKGV